MTNNIYIFFAREILSVSVLKFIVPVFLWLAIQTPALANNVAVANVSGVDRSTSSDTLDVEFDLSWSNSWKDSTNNDAAWVFVKYSTDSGTTWLHATLATAGTNPSGVSRGTKSSGAFSSIDIIVTNDKKGAFIQPAHPGSGALNFTNIQLVWDYGADGLSDATAIASTTVFKVFAIEMVYIPEGGFYAGDGNIGTYGQLEFGGASASLPGAINSEAGLSFGNSATQWYYNAPAPANSGEAADGTAFEVDEAYPKGFKAFYAMKYEITEGQWVEFFNTLTSAQKTTRDITAASGKNSDSTVNRNTISWTSGDATTSRSNRATGYISWMDVAAYADWAALRPMSELEFEKIFRGPIYPVVDEYAWGTTSATQGTAISGTEDGTETISTSNANVIWNNATFTGGDTGTGPVRAGIFATSSTTTRATAGAGYYGNLDLSGNLWERTVTLGNATGRGFEGSHGDGVLTATSSYEGNATNLDWPGLDSTSNARGITGATGSGTRGGSWLDTSARAMTSDRNYAALTDTSRLQHYGGRCVRTANS